MGTLSNLGDVPAPVADWKVRNKVGKCVRLRTTRGNEHVVQITGIRTNRHGQEFLLLRHPKDGHEIALKPFLNQIAFIEEIPV